MSEQSQAIARREPVGTELSTPQEFARYRQQAMADRCIVLSPVTDIGSMPEQCVFVPSAVQINVDEAFGEVYRDNLFCKGEEVALTKVGLRKVAKAAGISWDVVREDSGHVPNYWAMKCTCEARGHDGQVKHWSASYEWDLRDGQPRVKSMAEKELSRARLNGYRRCEAGAINAAIREYGLKQKYTKQELSKPFVVFNLVFKPDLSDPTQKRMLAESFMGASATLYGGPALAGETVNTRTGEIVDAMRHDEPEPAGDQSFGAAPAEPADPVYHVTDAGQDKRGGFYVTTQETNEEKLRTEDKAVTLAAHEKKTVHLELEKRGDDRWITEVRPALPASKDL